ncbi:MAG: hypothetical protein V3T70_06895, partial [Phycisphaerae bacterium]
MGADNMRHQAHCLLGESESTSVPIAIEELLRFWVSKRLLGVTVCVDPFRDLGDITGTAQWFSPQSLFAATGSAGALLTTPTDRNRHSTPINAHTGDGPWIWG